MKPNPQLPVQPSTKFASTKFGRAARFAAIVAVVSVAGLAGPTVAAADQVDQLADRPIERPDVRPDDHKLEQLRLECNVRQSDGHSAIGCHWSEPTSDRAAGVRLQQIVVGAGQGRETIYRSTNLEVTEYLDTAVRQGHRYVYAVQALNHDGRVVGMSRPVNIGVPPIDPPVDPPAIEVLGIHCAVGDIDPPTDRVHIGCEWRLPQAGTARLLTLWRSVDGGERERVAGFTHPFQTSYRDVVPAGTHRVAYAVIATNSEGEIVARSRAAHVAIPHDRPPPPTSIVPVPSNPDVVDPEILEPVVREPAPTTTVTETVPESSAPTTVAESRDESDRAEPPHPPRTRPERPAGETPTRPGQAD